MYVSINVYHITEEQAEDFAYAFFVKFPHDKVKSNYSSNDSCYSIKITKSYIGKYLYWIETEMPYIVRNAQELLIEMTGGVYDKDTDNVYEVYHGYFFGSYTNEMQSDDLADAAIRNEVVADAVNKYKRGGH